MNANFFDHLRQFGDLSALIVGTEHITYASLADGNGPVDLLRCLHQGIPYTPISPRIPEKQQEYQRQCLSQVPDCYATALFTSGSTGAPKIAVHTLDNHWSNAEGSNRNIPIGPGDRWLVSLPLYHVGGIGILFRCLLAGATAVLPPEGTREIASCIARYNITHVSLVHTQLRQLLDSPDSVRVKAILLGGSAIPSDLILRGQHLPLYRSYGLTEMSSQVTTTAAGAPHSSGRLLAHRELRFVQDEIHVRGRPLFAGYWRDGRIEPTLTADGWFATGDLGHLDQNGCLHITGRRDNLFISGGENIQPEEVEAAILQLPGVEQAVVVPIPDTIYGHRPIAYIQTADGSLPDLSVLEQHLPRFKLPVRVYSLQADPSGLKPSRKALATAHEIP